VQPLVAFAIYAAVVSSYYYLVARKRQYFSPEERTEMFVAYVIKGNAHA
jgi:hypothetical protein